MFLCATYKQALYTLGNSRKSLSNAFGIIHVMLFVNFDYVISFKSSGIIQNE